MMADTTLLNTPHWTEDYHAQSYGYCRWIAIHAATPQLITDYFAMHEDTTGRAHRTGHIIADTVEIYCVRGSQYITDDISQYRLHHVTPSMVMPSWPHQADSCLKTYFRQPAEIAASQEFDGRTAASFSRQATRAVRVSCTAFPAT